jgi:predicted flap endonuclease-1-like 5' DNA nuclease
MDNTAKTLWAVAAAVAVAAFIVLKWVAGYGWFGALVLMVLVFLLVALLLWILWDREPVATDAASRSGVAISSSAPVRGSAQDGAIAAGETAGPGLRPVSHPDRAAEVAPPPSATPVKASKPSALVTQMPDDPTTDDEIAADEALIAAGDTDPLPGEGNVPVDEFMEDGVSAEDYKRYGAIDDAEEMAEYSGEEPDDSDENPDLGAPEAPDAIRGGQRRAAARAGGRAARGAGAGDPRPGPRRGAKKAEATAVADPTRKRGATGTGAAPDATGKALPGKRGAAATPVATDDLKRIKGVGPKLERQLHALGITSFAQVAALTPADIARIGATLGFQGRIERDGWIEQAGTLAAGGETEFSSRVKKGGVY